MLKGRGLKKSIDMKKTGIWFKNADGVEYEICFRKPDARVAPGADGLCDSPNQTSPRIRVNPYRTPQTQLNTIVHEMAHAFFWDKSELEITKFGNAVSRVLYNRLGWRSQKVKAKKRLYQKDNKAPTK